MKEEKPIQERWGSALRHGFVVIPVALLQQQAALEIDNTEMIVLLNLLAQWHSDDKPAWVSYSSLSSHAGISRRTAQRALASLSEKKLIEVGVAVDGRAVNFKGLIERLSKGQLIQKSAMEAF